MLFIPIVNKKLATKINIIARIEEMLLFRKLLAISFSESPSIMLKREVWKVN